MQPSQARFVTVCQQLLALGVVLAVLTPAAGVISLDVVPDRSSGSATAAAVPMAAYARAATVPSQVPTEAVRRQGGGVHAHRAGRRPDRSGRACRPAR